MSARRLLSVGVVMVVAIAGLIVPAAAAADTLSGAGSALAAPLVAEWGAAFESFFGTVVSYDEAGSQAGLSDVTARVVDFAASDGPLTSAQLAACQSCVQLPWSLAAVGIGYHIGGIRRPLFLTGTLLAEIYLGEISRWNDPRITAVNPRGALPSLRITPIYVRAGETYAFTSFLSKVSRAWRTRVGYGFTASFPAGIPASSDVAATSLLESVNGSIAYVGAPFLIANRLPAAAIENSAGRFEVPNLSNIQAAAQTVTRVPRGNALQIVDPPRRATTAYPLSTFTFAVVPANGSNPGTLARWLSFALGLGQQFGPRLDSPPLPPVVLRASNATVASLRGSH
jgi:phosphate transport system substrate-binding protein